MTIKALLLPIVFIAAIAPGCAAVQPVPPLAPGADQVSITRNAADVAACKAVGNIDGKGIRRMYADLTRDQAAIAEVRNQAIGFNGNAVFDTSDAYQLSGVVYQCN